MNDLNYHHLKYFWAVARSETLTSAAEHLGLTPQTLSTQIKDLERSLGQDLFARSGRRLVLTDVGQSVFRYAEEIFAIGDELTEMVAGRAVGRAMQVALGVAEVLSKLVTHRLLEPAIKLDEPDDWFTEKGIRPRIVGEFEDSALLKAFGQAGAGLFPVPSIVEA